MAYRQGGFETPRPRDDLPFYNGRPVAISSLGWLMVVGAVIVAFIVLSLSSVMGMTKTRSVLSALFFAGFPLAALAMVGGRYWTALFRPCGWKELGWSVLFALVTPIVSGLVAFALLTIAPMQSNPALETHVQMTVGEIGVFLVRTFVQLIGEEVVTILPLLAVLWFVHSRLGLSRRSGIALGIVLSTVWFSAMHLPTYGWNFLQCFAVIGSSRLVLTAAYLLTRNLWVSAAAHILNDWTLFALSFADAHLSGAV